MNRNNGNNSISEQLVIGITMGEPAGIGPEVVVKALAEPVIRKAAKFIVFGMNEQLCYAADKAEIEPFWGRCQHEKIGRDYPHKVIVADYDEYSVPSWIKGPSRVGGEASIHFCLDAIEAAQGRHNRCDSNSANQQNQLEISRRQMARPYRNAGG